VLYAGDWRANEGNGAKQGGYNGKPHYAWTKNNMPGDAIGDGVNNVWHVAKP